MSTKVSSRQIKDIAEVVLDSNKQLRARFVLTNGYVFPQPGMFLNMEQLDKDLQKRVKEYYENSVE